MDIEKEIEEAKGDALQEVAKSIPDTPVAPAHGIAAIALNMALKYHQMTMIPDGLTYQQYKMEGRNIREIGLVDVFETAMKMEGFLLGASERIAKIVVDAIQFSVEDDAPSEQVDDPSLPEAESR